LPGYHDVLVPFHHSPVRVLGQKKYTVPSAAGTVAVQEIFVPMAVVPGEHANATAAFTVTVCDALTELLFASPLYVAVIVCVPGFQYSFEPP
jgi:hypothetical protein